MNYLKKLKDPRWQQKRLKILERDSFRCRYCPPDPNDHTELHVHHLWYVPGDPWDSPDEALITLCADHHKRETDERKTTEQKLLMALRKQGFSTDMIEEIADALDNQVKLEPYSVIDDIINAIYGMGVLN